MVLWFSLNSCSVYQNEHQDSSSGKYQPGEELTCHVFIAHSFDLNILGVQKQEMLLIWLLGLFWFSNDTDTCACKGFICDVNISITFLF